MIRDRSRHHPSIRWIFAALLVIELAGNVKCNDTVSDANPNQPHRELWSEFLPQQLPARALWNVSSGTPTNATAQVDKNDTGRVKLDTDPNIIGGTIATENPSFGFSAGPRLCGGTLIHPEYVR